MAAWTDFYNAAQGWGWLDCAGSLSDPCAACTAAASKYDQHHVSCAVVGGELRLVTIYLPDNGIRGLLPPSLAQLSALGVLNLATTSSATVLSANVFFNALCVSVPQCGGAPNSAPNASQAECDVQGSGVELC